MPTLSDSFIIVRLPSGNRALYRVQPQHLPREGVPASAWWPMEYGTQWAVEFDGQWCRYNATTGRREPITDATTVALIERCPEA